ncbi:MAG: EVE domain-containing protein [Caldimonas sp.]
MSTGRAAATSQAGSRRTSLDDSDPTREAPASEMSPRQFWIGVVSREHVQIGVAGGFIQLNHGKKAPLQGLRGGDGLVMYSPRTSYPDGQPLQHFTAIGVVATGEVYQVTMAEDFEPYRVDVVFAHATETPVKPLVESLAFIRNKTHWGAAFRFGYVKVPAADFHLIAAAMGVASEFPSDGP